MKRVVFSPDGLQRVPLHVWARNPPQDAMAQLQRIAATPYVVSHVAAMPDLHMAENVAVGTVFATEQTLVPAALGGDLGCGISAARTGIAAAQLGRRDLERLLEGLASTIPTGSAVHRRPGTAVSDDLLASPLSTHALERDRVRLAARHLGTLGGGNHFLELDRDPNGGLWLLVHSGSRGLGSAIAEHHRRAAAALGSEALAGLDAESDEGRAYLNDLSWALRFAEANRARVLARAADAMSDYLGEDLAPEQVIDAVHNFVRRERLGERDLWVHRKGAVAAYAGELLVVPGSMGTATYVAEGLGKADAFRSCSHGAGRVMSRSRARHAIRADRAKASMGRVVLRAASRTSLVEEAPAAYRNIRDVLEDEADLVRPVLRLEPIAVLKG